MPCDNAITQSKWWQGYPCWRPLTSTFFYPQISHPKGQHPHLKIFLLPESINFAPKIFRLLRLIHSSRRLHLSSWFLLYESTSWRQRVGAECWRCHQKTKGVEFGKVFVKCCGSQTRRIGAEYHFGCCLNLSWSNIKGIDSDNFQQNLVLPRVVGIKK